MTWDEHYLTVLPRVVELLKAGVEIECLRLGPEAMRAFVTHRDTALKPHPHWVNGENAEVEGEWKANGVFRVVPMSREGIEVVEKRVCVAAPGLPLSSSPSLRLWLPEVHTLSLNRTKGRHWSQSYRARKGEAAALLEALGQVVESVWPGQAMLREGCRVLGLLALGQDVRKIRLPVFPKPSRRLEIVYTRVTVQPLDAENWCGSTKGMTDCLKYAFPGLLPDDAPEFVEIVHRQVKCAKRCEEGTWVELRLGIEN